MSIQPPLAIVTGASSGIGCETARLLARRGYRTVLIARREERIKTLAGELAQLAPSRAVVMDLGKLEEVEITMRVLVQELGPIALLVNNAGYGLYRRFLDYTVEEFDRLLAVNYEAAVRMIRVVLPGMLERGEGHVINVASISTKCGPYGHSAYAGAKSALIALTESLAMEYKDRGVRFSYINPGIVRTEFFDNPTYSPLLHQVQHRGIPPQRVARMIVRLLDRSRLVVHVPRLYRLMDVIKAISPTLLHRLVCWGSRPRE